LLHHWLPLIDIAWCAVAISSHRALVI